ncbi:DUF885 domain-containing protein [Amycolatopsis sp. PS_44_ISF1]|uniref:DUF885 domain-containing protein n=1 Tax=Amycolatopsis sp. PS_44_ISF1 TaxID=2974917 RepID=UPI0028DD64F5|nr:DUF885 domain-containing protein [Amycolatopsis sp. PS_44_ISF1]MDT8913352.1 DUF885 domain-containing protein [Amycolatopsis sp. PS_44_ISF1]
MTPIFQLSDDHVTAEAALDPVAATIGGVVTDPSALTDYSPDGAEARAELTRRTLAALAALTPESASDRIAGAHLRERLEAQLAWHDLGEPLRTVQAHFGILNSVHDTVDMLPRTGDEDWRVIARRLAGVETMLDGWRSALGEGLDRGLPAARRQALETAAQAEQYVGKHEALLDGYGEGALSGELRAAADAAYRGYSGLAAYLREEYAPRATEVDGVGAERYAVGARLSLGADVDLAEAYEWGWAELERIESELAEEAASVRPGATVAQAQELLDAAYSVDGEASYLDWLRARHDRALEAAAEHFDIPEPLRTLDVTIAHGSASGAPYYTGPSEDGTRPGRTWWPLGGRERFAVWRELTTVLHEGVPGHHLQIGTAKLAADRVSRFARSHSVSGHAEGWALYAERLSDELGWYTEPGTRLGMLSGSALRAARVVIDLGAHLDLPLPDGSRWSFETACRVLHERGLAGRHQVHAEVVRYYGWPGQAISYKLGERAWLQAREEASRRPGFTLRSWHREALEVGPVGLAALQEALRPTA